MYGRTNRDLFTTGAKMTAAGIAAFAGYNTLTGNEKFYRNCIMPTSRLFLDGEAGHKTAVWLAKVAYPRLWGNRGTSDFPVLRAEVAGLSFDNVVGLAAGFDKDAECVNTVASNSGFGFVEIGSVTPIPQPGNMKPRVFRLIEDDAVINRYGFNSAGYQVVLNNLEKTFSTTNRTCVVGVNLGKNKNDDDFVSGYCRGYESFVGRADYIVINLSSPNTPGLRDLQRTSELNAILDALAKTKKNCKLHPPLFVKISPDLGRDDLKNISEVVLKRRDVVDGLIVTNTTVSRPSLKSTLGTETGGLSGAPLKDLSTECIRAVYKLTKGNVPIIGCGGVASGQDALDKIKAGASLVQLYTALVYGGFPVVGKVRRELAELLTEGGFSSVKDAVGVDSGL